MIITKMSLPRRTMLRGMGAALALPLLDAMVPALSALAKSAANPAKRLGFIYVPNGIQMENFLPKTVGTAFEMSPILSPLTPFRDQLTIVSGLANSQADPLDQGGGPHARAAATWLNGCRPKRTEGADIHAGITIDQIAANTLGEETPLSSLQLALEPNFVAGNCESGYSCSYINTISWKTPTMPLPMETNPYVVFERLFGDGRSAARRIAELREDRSILDATAEDMTRLQRRLGARDRTTVTEYLEAVRDVERRLQKTEQQAAATPTSMEKPLGIPESFEDHANLMFDLQLLAYQADITRVVAFQIAREISGRTYPSTGVTEGHHEISHHQYNPERMAKNTKINLYHMQLFARFVENMRNTPDGDGSLLDHAILFYGAGMGNGNEHFPHNLPVVLVGGGSGQLKGARHVAAPTETPLMNLGLTLLDKVGAGAEVKTVGDSTGRLADL